MISTLLLMTILPLINNVGLSSSVIEIGHTFHLSLTSANDGDSADIQTISAGFPNLTSIDGNVQIRQSDFNQKPILIKKGEMVGSDYQGAEHLISVRYPSIEAHHRQKKESPWQFRGLYSLPNLAHHIL
jgi:hypothetical protein